MSSQPFGLCLRCNKSVTEHCRQCESALYCSSLCKEADLPIHELLCPSFVKFKTSTRPTVQHIRAFFFPEDNNRPRPIWLYCPSGVVSYFIHYQAPLTKSYLNLKDNPTGVEPITYNVALQRNLPDVVLLHYHDDFRRDGYSLLSKSFLSIDKSRSTSKPLWRGPAIAFGAVGQSQYSTTYRDLDMNDFGHIADWYTKRMFTLLCLSIDDNMIEGIRINCHGDQKMLNRPFLEKVEVRDLDFIYHNQRDIPEIAKHVGYTLLTQRCIPDARWAKDQSNQVFDQSPFANEAAAYLHLCCDNKASNAFAPGQSSWGMPTFPWQDNVGSIIVVRQDKVPLSPLLMEALCKYSRDEVHPILMRAKTSGEQENEELAKQMGLAMINRDAFSVWWHKFLSEKLGV